MSTDHSNATDTLIISIDAIVAIVGAMFSSYLAYSVYKKKNFNDFNTLIFIMAVSEFFFFLGFSNYAIGR
jgi:hypothetical protein